MNEIVFVVAADWISRPDAPVDGEDVLRENDALFDFDIAQPGSRHAVPPEQQSPNLLSLTIPVHAFCCNL